MATPKAAEATPPLRCLLPGSFTNLCLLNAEGRCRHVENMLMCPFLGATCQISILFLANMEKVWSTELNKVIHHFYYSHCDRSDEYK